MSANVRGLIAVGAFVLCAWGFAQVSPWKSAAAPSEPKFSDQCPGGEGMAFVMSQKYVTETLRSPSTASYPREANSTKLGTCKFVIRSYADAQNGFGATIRTRYSIVMEFLRGNRTWRGTDLIVE